MLTRDVKEIGDFREVFTFWAVKAVELDGGTGSDKPAVASKSPMADEHKEEESRNQTLTISGMQRIIRSLSMHLSHQEQVQRL